MFGYYVYHLIILESQKKLTRTVYHNTHDDMIHISGGPHDQYDQSITVSLQL